MRMLLIAALLALPLTATPALAQYGRYPVPNYGPGYRGNISPYLNIFRGTNTGIDYYLGTRSEQQRRTNAQEFREELDALPYRDTVRGEDLPNVVRPIPSGSYALLNNTGGYFNNTGGYFAYPGRGGNQPIRPGAYTPPPRRAGSPSRTGPNPGFQPRPFVNPPQTAPGANPTPGGGYNY